MLDITAAVAALANLTNTVLEKAIPEAAEARSRLLLRLKETARAFTEKARKNQEERERKLINGK